MDMDEDSMSFRSMLKKANDEQAAKRGLSPHVHVYGPNVAGGCMPNYGPTDREATTPIEPEIRSDKVQGATRKEVRI